MTIRDISVSLSSNDNSILNCSMSFVISIQILKQNRELKQVNKCVRKEKKNVMKIWKDRYEE